MKLCEIKNDSRVLLRKILSRKDEVFTKKEIKSLLNSQVDIQHLLADLPDNNKTLKIGTNTFKIYGHPEAIKTYNRIKENK